MVSARRPSSQAPVTEPFEIPQSHYFVGHCTHLKDSTMFRFTLVLLIAALSLSAVTCFSVQPAVNQPPTTTRLSPLFMGRAAAVRAATKSKTDDKKAKTNALYGKRIIMAVKQGGSDDPVANRMLADVIKAAKTNNVPIDNINRAIKRATEGISGDFSESTFEAYGHGGASFVINVLSDNANRASADVKSTVNRRNAKIAEQGSVLFMYDRKGKVEVAATLDEEALLNAAIEGNIEDFLLEEGTEEGTSVVFVEPTDTAAMAEVIKGMGHEECKTSLVYVSKAPVECSDEDFEKNMQIIEALEDLDDVDSVEHNMSN